MANKVDVFTEELSKVFTILQQQYVMIKYMKSLITSGELDESEINKLKEQITAINKDIDTINKDQIAPIKQDVLHIEEGMSEFEKVMPTDINIDSTGNLILEHDGIEITGQKKQVEVYTKEQIEALLTRIEFSLFRHDLLIEHTRTSYDEYAFKIYITYYSKNPLIVDSVQDLTRVTKATNGTKFVNSVIVNNTTGDDSYDTISEMYIGVGYNGSIWSLIDLDGSLITNIPINKVSDTVTPILN